MNDPLKIQAAQRINGAAAPAASPTTARPVSGPGFAQTLSEVQGLRFSNHAQQRLQSREIQLSDDGVNRLSHAVEKAEKRGGKSSLVLMDDLAFIVNVRERLVVTAMETAGRGEGVFTQIDTVVIADAPDETRPASIDRTA
ncbi:MAG TPA: TIGR02530 family flagellar biosynthesis protein [Anaerolineaceae bacterium]|nr:TIGR02530 family flagellar biosynthesis protein [Anaerolineaceae bacterium]